ncbi:MAG: FAD-dependent oxidoreductase, partial [Paracoccaceae bacterium]
DVQPFLDASGIEIRADTYKIFGVPLRACVAPRGVCDNLIVAWGISSSEVAFSAIRLEPFLSAVGEACGHVAVAAIDTGIDPALIDYAAVRARLDAAGLTIHRFNPVAT